MAQQPLVSQVLLLVEDSSWSHSDLPRSVGLLWTSDQPHAETSTWQHTTLPRDQHPCNRWDSNPHRRKRRPQTNTLDRAAIGIGRRSVLGTLFNSWKSPAEKQGKIHSTQCLMYRTYTPFPHSQPKLTYSWLTKLISGKNILEGHFACPLHPPPSYAYGGTFGAARLLGSRVRILPKAKMLVSCVCFALCR